MTNGNGSTVLMSPTASTLKRSLRSATRVQSEQLEEAALIKEENQMLDDEEVTSEEEGDGDGDTVVERTIFTVALVNSVVDSHQSSSDLSQKSDGSADNRKYGLRKRRRQSGEDLKRLEHNQMTKDGGLARQKDRTATQECDIFGETTAEIASAAAIPLPPATAPIETHKKVQTQPVITQLRVKDPPHVARKNNRRPLKPPKPMSTPILPSSSSVPNPLSKPLPSTLTPSFPTKTIKCEPEQSFKSVTVPCPLPAVAFDEKVDFDGDKRKVNFNDMVGTTRLRGFSIDMDSVGLDFPDDNSVAETGDLPLVGGRRDRAFSFECFAFGINADEPLPPLEQSVMSHPGGGIDSMSGRLRGDSIIFDPSSFQEGGIHEQTALERNRATAEALKPTLVMPKTVSVSRETLVLPPPLLASNTPIPLPEVQSSMQSLAMTNYAGTTMQNPASTTVTTPGGSATFSLELLNKDGRIGIYLPDARRARIARFHAKRIKRIWRKRIKYDCRKKLADSRPRIKGRFVKRSDMDDE